MLQTMGFFGWANNKAVKRIKLRDWGGGGEGEVLLVLGIQLRKLFLASFLVMVVWCVCVCVGVFLILSCYVGFFRLLVFGLFFFPPGSFS